MSKITFVFQTIFIQLSFPPGESSVYASV